VVSILPVTFLQNSWALVAAQPRPCNDLCVLGIWPHGAQLQIYDQVIGYLANIANLAIRAT
jgi:hypothetical protein